MILNLHPLVAVVLLLVVVVYLYMTMAVYRSNHSRFPLIPYTCKCTHGNQTEKAKSSLF